MATLQNSSMAGIHFSVIVEGCENAPHPGDVFVFCADGSVADKEWTMKNYYGDWFFVYEDVEYPCELVYKGRSAYSREAALYEYEDDGEPEVSSAPTGCRPRVTGS